MCHSLLFIGHADYLKIYDFQEELGYHMAHMIVIGQQRSHSL
ncbi:hypothetical protein DSUL_60297 [Desulfovibrionales bacterium]